MNPVRPAAPPLLGSGVEELDEMENEKRNYFLKLSQIVFKKIIMKIRFILVDREPEVQICSTIS